MLKVPIDVTPLNYLPQMKFAKVMFSQVSVCPWGGRPPPGQSPPTQCMLGYGQQAGGTHPTGMQSCLAMVSVVIFYCRHGSVIADLTATLLDHPGRSAHFLHSSAQSGS